MESVDAARKRVDYGQKMGIGSISAITVAIVVFVVIALAEVGTWTQAAETPLERADEIAGTCVKAEQLRLADKGYSYKDGYLGAVINCTAELHKARELRR